MSGRPRGKLDMSVVETQMLAPGSQNSKVDGNGPILRLRSDLSLIKASASSSDDVTKFHVNLVDGGEVPISRSDETTDTAPDVAQSLFSELPDFKQKLFVPTGPCFPRFPQFPAEIRLMIWKEALPPGRQIDLGPGCVERDIHGRVAGPIYRLPRTRHPAMLSVNLESRTVAQYYYKTIYRNLQTDLSRPAKLASMSFSITRDTFGLQLMDAAGSDIDWASDLVIRNPGSLNGIKSLQIIDRLWSDVDLRLIEVGDSERPDVALRFFRELEDIELVVTKQKYKNKDYAAIMAEFASSHVHEVRGRLQGYFARRNEEDGPYAMPEFRVTDHGAA